MARISAKEKEEKQKKYDEVVFNIFITEGWDAISYGRIAKEVGVTASSLQNYYPRLVDFGRALQGRVFPMVAHQLDFSSKEAFVSSWDVAIQGGGLFPSLVRMLIQSALETETSPQTIQGIIRLKGILGQQMSPEDADSAIKSALGTTIITLMNQ